MSFAQVVLHSLSRLYRLFYLGEKRKGEILYRVNEKTRFKIRVNTADKHTVWESWKLQVYEDPGQLIREPDTVVDIGANIGAFSIWASQQASKGKVLAFEPEQKNDGLLVRNKSLNRCSNLSCYHLAVGAASAPQTLYTHIEQNNVCHSLFPDEHWIHAGDQFLFTV